MSQIQMPKYKCHKEVWALKIKSIEQAPVSHDCDCRFPGGDWVIIPEDDRYSPFYVGHDDYILKHRPHAGGYYVVYEDGYASFSPAKAFEDGYSLLLNKPCLSDRESQYKDILNALGVQGHAGAIAEINALRKIAKLD